VSYNSRQVTARHVAARQYSAWSYISAVLINHFPIAVLSDILFCTLLYWMANYVANAGERGGGWPVGFACWVARCRSPPRATP